MLGLIIFSGIKIFSDVFIEYQHYDEDNLINCNNYAKCTRKR